MPYSNVPKSKWEKMDRCVKDVMAKDGVSKSSAIAICHTSIVGHEAVSLHGGGRVVEGRIVEETSDVNREWDKQLEISQRLLDRLSIAIRRFAGQKPRSAYASVGSIQHLNSLLQQAIDSIKGMKQ